MSSDITHRLARAGFPLKPTFLKVLANPPAKDIIQNTTSDASMPSVWNAPLDSPLRSQIKWVDGLRILGGWLDGTGSTESAVNYAMAQMGKHWASRQQQLCNQRVPLQKRLLRYVATVQKTG